MTDFPYSEQDLLPLSALNHYLYCKRRCALVHIEQAWQENVFTAEGRIMHERVDSGGRESRGKVRQAFGLALRSLQLGLSGKADVVEFYLDDDGNWQPSPVEHKRGRPKKDSSDLVQLCAQAICIEEMLACHIKAGAMFYGKTRRRQEVVFDESLRAKTTETARSLHDLLTSGRTPQARYEKKCDSCSLISLCMPKVTGTHRSVQGYMAKVLEQKP